MKAKRKNITKAKPVEIPFNEADLQASVAGFVAQLRAGTTEGLRVTNVTASRSPGGDGPPPGKESFCG